MKFISVKNVQGQWFRTDPRYGSAFADSGAIVVFDLDTAVERFGEKLKDYKVVEMSLNSDDFRTWAARSLGSIKSVRKAQTSRENGRKSVGTNLKAPAQPEG